MKYVIGIDEAGRGPLAGPLTLAAFQAPKSLKEKLVEILGGKIKDSKKFSEKRRKEIYKKLLKLKKEEVKFEVAYISNKIIDEKGIAYATNLGIKKCLKKFENPKIKILLDGGLKAPKIFKNQETIIGGDEKNIFIACASIVAKVRRDRLMCRLAKKYPEYALEVHKGYGTELHHRLIKECGISPIHRKTFLKKLT